VLVFFGFMVGPLSWAVAVSVNYAFASYVCFPTSVRLTAPLSGWEWAPRTLVPIVIVIAFILSLAGAAVSYRTWSRTKMEAAGHALEIGEGRTRFMAAWGLMTSAAFAGLLVFDFVNYLVVPPCAT
jgi:hypothetical protein